MLSSLMMSVYRRGNHVSTLVLPISGEAIKFMGEIYVDDTNLLTILPDVFDNGNLDKWAKLLIATGGTLNPDKCYWYMVSCICREGEWMYDKTKLYELTIILPDGTCRAITQLRVTDSRKMLGVWSSPNGSDKKHLQEVVIGKTTKWVGRLKNSHLPLHLAWKACCFQLWPEIRYGLLTLATPLQDMENILHKLEFEMLSALGVIQHVKTE
jgi:hypothetical protein